MKGKTVAKFQFWKAGKEDATFEEEIILGANDDPKAGRIVQLEIRTSAGMYYIDVDAHELIGVVLAAIRRDE